MTPIPDVFLDTSALFAGIWSAAGGARMLLKLGEARIVKLHVSSLILTEIEAVLRRKSPESLGNLALLLDRSRIRMTPEPSAAHLRRCAGLVDYAPDAQVLAAAWTAVIDYFVTLDRRHFLHNQVMQTVVPFPVGTPGDCLAWYRKRIISSSVS